MEFKGVFFFNGNIRYLLFLWNFKGPSFSMAFSMEIKWTVFFHGNTRYLLFPWNFKGPSFSMEI